MGRNLVRPPASSERVGGSVDGDAAMGEPSGPSVVGALPPRRVRFQPPDLHGVPVD